mmetsp:Transcript_32322/g.68856  ORF Transcript_32322/g.68856 Transcript_32322/m.68856 type:complete len:482 (+) Transcript_32322:68-1513(+)
MIILGILLEVLAAALGTTSKQLIAYSEYSKKRWIFHLGAGINIFVGPVVDASAYAFAPSVVIAPFACLDVIFNALTAPYTLHWQKERLSRAHIFGTGLVALGAVFTSFFGSVTDTVLSVYELEAQLMKPASLGYLTVELTLILGINLCLRARLLSPTLRGISLGVVAGILMGNVFFLKGFVGIVQATLAHGEVEAWLRPTPYLCVAAAGAGAVLGHIFMRRGLGEYKGVFMVTIFEGAHITAACLSGCVVMSEMAHAPWWQYCGYWASVLGLVAGMLLINTAAQESEIEAVEGEKELADAGAEKLRPKAFHIAQSFVRLGDAARGAAAQLGTADTYPQPCRLLGDVLGIRCKRRLEAECVKGAGQLAGFSADCPEGAGQAAKAALRCPGGKGGRLEELELLEKTAFAAPTSQGRCSGAIVSGKQRAACEKGRLPSSSSLSFFTEAPRHCGHASLEEGIHGLRKQRGARSPKLAGDRMLLCT